MIFDVWFYHYYILFFWGYISPYTPPAFIPPSHPMLPRPVFSALARPTRTQKFRQKQVAYLDDKKHEKTLFMCEADVVPFCVVPLKGTKE